MSAQLGGLVRSEFGQALAGRSSQIKHLKHLGLSENLGEAAPELRQAIELNVDTAHNQIPVKMRRIEMKQEKKTRKAERTR